MQDDCPTFAPGESKETILFQVQLVLELCFPFIRGIHFLMLILNLQAALAIKWNEPPRDAFDAMILITGLKLPQVCFKEDNYSYEEAAPSH